MKAINLLILAVFLSLHTVFAQKNVIKDNSQIAERSYLVLPKIRVIPIKDTKTKRTYELYVKLPEEYSENKDKEYPVIYFTDALWHVEILSGSAEYIVEDAILVGISWQKDIDENLINEIGEHVSRFRDYSLKKSSNQEYQAKYKFGQANDHMTFIRNDVIPYVEKTFRTNPDNRSYFGYSLGGLFGAYILLAQPDTFKNYILGSPSVKGDISFLSGLKSKNLNANVFISYGSLEKELGIYTDRFINMLESRKGDSLFLKHMVIEGSHQTAFPMTGVHSMHWLSNLIKE